MSRIAPKPVIRLVVRTWQIQPGMTFAVAEDIHGQLWIEESCPVGTHYWTVEQAACLSAGPRTQRALDEAIAVACDRRSLDHLPTLPVFDGELESAISASPSRQHRVACKSERRLAGV